MYILMGERGEGKKDEEDEEEDNQARTTSCSPVCVMLMMTIKCPVTRTN